MIICIVYLGKHSYYYLVAFCYCETREYCKTGPLFLDDE